MLMNVRAAGSKFEAFQKMSDSPLTLCEACGGALKKLMFPVGIVFKGSGFYVNDYAKKSGGNGSEAPPSKAPDSTPAASETKTSETKTETPAKESPRQHPRRKKARRRSKAPTK